MVNAFKPGRWGNGWIIFLLILGACLEPVNIRIEEGLTAGRAVINGQVSTLPERTIVEVGLTASEFSKPIPVPGADVQLLDGNGNRFILSAHPQLEGTYTAHGFTGIPGERYHVEVTLPDGRQITSAEEVLPQTSGTDNVSHEMVLAEFIDADGALLRDAQIRIFTKPTLPSNGQRFFRWSVEEVYLIRPTNFPDPFGITPPDCFVTNPVDAQRLVLFDGRLFTGAFPEPQLLAIRSLDLSFFYKHYFTIYLSSITPAALEYWKQVQAVANQTGSIFDTPPAEVRGNMNGPGSQTVYGYFQATNETLSRFSIQRTDLPEYAFLNEYCDFSYDRNYDDYLPECLNCINFPNSSYTRPDWF